MVSKLPHGRILYWDELYHEHGLGPWIEELKEF